MPTNRPDAAKPQEIRWFPHGHARDCLCEGCKEARYELNRRVEVTMNEAKERLLAAIGDALDHPATDEQQAEMLAAIGGLVEAASLHGAEAHYEVVRRRLSALRHEKEALQRELSRFTNDA